MRITLLLLIIFLNDICHAQNHTVHHFGVAEGLPSSEVYDIIQDKKGFLWFATDNGVVRYDGYQFKTFSTADGIPAPVISGMVEDSSGKIWLRAFSGKIVYIENEKVIPYKFNKQLISTIRGDIINSMVFDSKGQLWFATNLLWGFISSTGKVFEERIPPGNFFYKSVENKSVHANNYFPWISGALIDGRRLDVNLPEKKGPKATHPSNKAFRWKNNLYITANNNIFRYDGKTLTMVYTAPSAIISFSTDNSGHLWVGLISGGAKRFDDDHFEDHWTPTFSEELSITKIFEDHEGGLWVSTLENGVFYLPNENIKHYSLNSNSKTRAVHPVGDKIFTGAYDGMLTIIDSKSKEPNRFKKFSREILSIFSTEGNIWVSASDSLYILNEQLKLTKSRVGAFKAATMRADTIWSIANPSVAAFDKQGNLLALRHNRASCRNIVVLNSTLLISQHIGLLVTDHKLNVVKTPSAFASLKISRMLSLNDSTVLIATIGNGLWVCDNSLENINRYPLAARNIYDILHDQSTVWLATEKGIIKTTSRSLVEGAVKYDLITSRSGLLNEQITHLATLEDEIFVFYNNRFSVVSPSNKNYVNQSPTFYVKGLSVNNNMIEYSAGLNLAYNQNNIHLDFGFISLNNQDIQVRYRLNETSSWNYTTERAISLYSLTPAAYAIELEYSTDRFHWHKVPVISIHISPPWWGTIWFLLFAFFSVFSVVLLFVRNRYKNMMLITGYQQRLLRSEIDTSERERLRIAQELHDRVGTDLSAMKMIVGQLLLKNDETQSVRVENNFQEMIREIKDIIYNLSPPGLERFGLFQTIKNYIEKLHPIGTQIRFNTFGNDITNPELGIAIFRVLQELISNSLKYSSAQTITIHINSFPDLVNIVYEDNGKGFSPNLEKIGMGLQNIEARVRSFDGQITFESGAFGVSYSIDFPIRALKR